MHRSLLDDAAEGSYEDKDEVVPVRNQVPRHEDVSCA
jgi:hypothetical protein